MTVPAGTSVMRAAAECGGSTPASVRPIASRLSGPAGCAWSRSRGGAVRPPAAPLWSNRAWLCIRRLRHYKKLRKGLIELYISGHPLDCLTCSASNDCELQDTAAEVGLRDVRYGYAGENHLGLVADT